jgi:hypothetical protein
MDKFTPNDIYMIQECLCSYKVLLNWLPNTSKEDSDLKYVRLQTIHHLIDRCDEVLEAMANE